MPDTNLLFLIGLDGETGMGFAEASIRHDYVNGCETSPVVFLEGIYVRSEYRKRRRPVDRRAEPGAQLLALCEVGGERLARVLRGEHAHVALGLDAYYRIEAETVEPESRPG